MTLALSRGALKVSSGFFNGLCKVSKGRHEITQVAFITSKKMREDRPPRPAPFPYRDRYYRAWQVWTDNMEARFDDNSKVIVVEGLPTVGKAKFCKQLAEELDMYHFPTMTFDDLYVDAHGFDYRTLNPKLPKDAKYYDLNMFLQEPKGWCSTIIQVHQYAMKYMTYVDALAHVLNTGVGVVLERSPWSDRVFAKAMETCGYIPRRGMDYYASCNLISLHHLLRPHVCIYLDVSAETVKANIQKRARPYEKDSPALTIEYLKELERNYKELCLPEIAKHAHLLAYDWENEGFIEDVIDDIEDLECRPEKVKAYGDKLLDWNFYHLDQIRARRTIYTNNRIALAAGCFTCRWDVPEVLRSGASDAKLDEVLEELYLEDPGKQYAYGFDPKRDTGILFKCRDSSADYASKVKTIENK